MDYATDPLLPEKEIQLQLKKLPQWNLSAEGKSIYRSFRFKSYTKTVLFVNAVAFLASESNHHPEIEFGFDYCTVTFSTHSADGLTLQDFMSAARIEALVGG